MSAPAQTSSTWRELAAILAARRQLRRTLTIVDGNRKLNRARQPNIDQLRREPGSISSREEAGVGSGGLG